jgi:hypothetical protein
MPCSIYRRRISRSLDSGRPLTGRVERHLLRCASCREFAGRSQEIGRLLARQAASLLQVPATSLEDGIRRRLGEAVEAPAPASRKRLRLGPALAAAGALGIVTLTIIGVVSSRPGRMPPLDPPLSLESPAAYLEIAFRRAESPYEEELRALKQAWSSAARALQASLEVDLGEGPSGRR